MKSSGRSAYISGLSIRFMYSVILALRHFSVPGLITVEATSLGNSERWSQLELNLLLFTEEVRECTGQRTTGAYGVYYLLNLIEK